jgi:protein arginine phosphatase
MRTILFVCKGNTCRSPMAAALARRIAGEDVKAESAGVHASQGAHATPEAKTVAREHCFDLSEHRAQRLTRELVDRADVVVAFDPVAAEAAGELGAERKTRLMRVADPFGQGLSAYRRTFAELESALQEVL